MSAVQDYRSTPRKRLNSFAKGGAPVSVSEWEVFYVPTYTV